MKRHRWQKQEVRHELFVLGVAYHTEFMPVDMCTQCTLFRKNFFVGSNWVSSLWCKDGKWQRGKLPKCEAT